MYQLLYLNNIRLDRGFFFTEKERAGSRKYKVCQEKISKYKPDLQFQAYTLLNKKHEA